MITLSLPAIAWAQESPVASASFRGRAVAVGVGYVWGEGELDYEGRRRPFQVRGLSLVGVGAEALSGTAKVFNLQSVDDFAGTYVVATTGAAAGDRGAGTATLTNTKGVSIHLDTRETGLLFRFGAGGVVISWADPPEAQP